MSKDISKNMNENTSENEFDFVFDSTSSLQVDLIINVSRGVNPEALLSLFDTDNKTGAMLPAIFETLSERQQAAILIMARLYLEKVRLEASHKDTRQIEEVLRWLEQNARNLGDDNPE